MYLQKTDPKRTVMEEFSLFDKRIIVTGGSGLLGQAWCQAIVEAGGTAVNVDFVKPRGIQADDYSNGYAGIWIQADITRWTEVVDALQLKDPGEFDGLVDPHYHGIVNAAFYNPPPARTSGYLIGNVDAHDWEYQSKMVEAAKNMIEWAGGHRYMESIVNIGSDLSLIGPDPRLYEGRRMKDSHYTAFKHAIVGLTKHYAPLLSLHNPPIRINTLCPGGVRQSMDEDFMNNVRQLVPMRRMAEKDEYNAAIVFLLSDASSYMTGATLSIDGGRTCW